MGLIFARSAQPSLDGGRHGTPVDWAIDSAGAALAAYLPRARDRTAA
jgi:hypothetical protein